MPLDPDAQALIDARAELGPRRSMRERGVGAVRAMIAAGAEAAPPSPPIHSVTNETALGPHGPVPVRVYRPREGALPAVVYLHGGGWTFGNLDGFDALCRALSTEADCVVVSVDYRLAPEHKFPIPIDDCQAALTWVVESIDRLGACKDRIALGGDSAGANLAIAVARRSAARPNGISLRGLLLVYPATEHVLPRPSWVENGAGPTLTSDDIMWLWEQYLRDQRDLQNPEAIPSLASDLHLLPPAFVQTAEYDPLRDGGEHFARLLKESGVPVEMKRYAGAFHGFYPMVGALARASEAVSDSAAFLRRMLYERGAPTAPAPVSNGLERQ